MLSSYIVSDKIIKDTSFYEVSFLFMASKAILLPTCINWYCLTFSIYKELTLLAQQPAFTSFTKHFQSNNKISKNLFQGRRIALSSQPNCFSISAPYFSHKKSTAFSLQSHCFYPPIPQLLPSKNIAFAPPMHHPMKTKFIFKS